MKIFNLFTTTSLLFVTQLSANPVETYRVPVVLPVEPFKPRDFVGTEDKRPHEAIAFSGMTRFKEAFKSTLYDNSYESEDYHDLIMFCQSKVINVWYGRYAEVLRMHDMHNNPKVKYKYNAFTNEIENRRKIMDLAFKTGVRNEEAYESLNQLLDSMIEERELGKVPFDLSLSLDEGAINTYVRELKTCTNGLRSRYTDIQNNYPYNVEREEDILEEPLVVYQPQSGSVGTGGNPNDSSVYGSNSSRKYLRSFKDLLNHYVKSEL